MSNPGQPVNGASGGSDEFSSDDLAWKSEFEAARHTQLKDVRGTAASWAGGIAALVGGFSALSVVFVPGKVSDLNTSWATWGVLILALISGGTGLYALVLANSAAQGTPTNNPVEDWRAYKGHVLSAVNTVSGKLRRSRIWTAIAVGAIIAAAILTQIDGLTTPTPKPLQVIVSSPAGPALCGTLTTGTDSAAQVGATTIPAGSTVIVVDHC